jgi:nicotinate dehydrogenase large molybdopterin subunit
LPPILSPEDALRSDAPKLHPKGNITADLNLSVGDVDAGMAEADLILEDTYSNEPIEHCFLESQAGLAFVEPNGRLTLLVSTQYPHFHQKQLTRVTGLPSDKVRVIQTVIGGAFGGKIDVTIECAASLLALKTKRPVKMVLDREEVFSSTTKRHAMKIRHRMGLMKNGRIRAIEIDILCDGGAYASYSMTVAGRCLMHSSLPYDVPNVRSHITTTFTNHVPAGAMRSFGIVKIAFATESQLNKAAAQLGISPIAIRRLNAVRSGTKTITGQRLDDVGFEQTLDVIEPIYEARRKARRDAGSNEGLGVACLGYGIGYTGIRNPATARVEADGTGTVTVYCGTPDIGTGSDTMLGQIAADAVGVNVKRVRVVTGDSEMTDDSGPTSASRSTYFSGSAARAAGSQFQSMFVAAFASKLQIEERTVKIVADKVIVGNEEMPFESACALLGDKMGEVRSKATFDPDSALDFKTFRGMPYPTYTFATHLVELDVDEDTGAVDVLGYWAAHDAGNIVNPMNAEGQVEGGIVMGLGMALWEKVVREGGYVQNPSYRDYLLPGSKDVPSKISTTFVKNVDNSGPFGAKGLAEPTIVPVPAAIAAAVADVTGAWATSMPMDAESLFKLFQANPNRRLSTTRATERGKELVHEA